MSYINEVEKDSSSELSPEAKGSRFADIGFGMFSRLGTTALNHILQQELIEDERKWQKQMFNLENAYNSPVAMAQRMRHAGLNPYAMTGQQVAGSFNSASYPTAPQLDDPFDNLVKAAQIQNINADTKKKENESAVSYAEARKKAVEADNWDEYWRLTLDKLKSEGSLTDEQIETEKAKALKEYALARKADEDASQFESFGNSGGNIYRDSSSLTAAQIRNLDEATSLLEKQISRYDEKMDAEILELNASANLAYENARKAKSETEVLRYLNESNELKSALRKFYGIDVDAMPLHIQFMAYNNFKAVKDGNSTPQEAYRGLLTSLIKYRKKANSTIISTSSKYGFGPFSYGSSGQEIL